MRLQRLSTQRRLTGIAIATLLAVVLVSSVTPATAAPGGDYYCGYLAAGPTGNNHQVYVEGILGFMDYARNPTNVEVFWDDGTSDSIYLTGSNHYFYLEHTYDTGGYPHIKLFTEDADGDSCQQGNPVEFNFWVS